MNTNLEFLLDALSEDTDDRGLRLVTSDLLEELGRTDEANLLRSPETVMVLEGRVIDLTYEVTAVVQDHNRLVLECLSSMMGSR